MRAGIVACLFLLGCGTDTTNLVPLPIDSAGMPMSCAPEGAACTADPECCASPMSALHCKPDGPGLTTRHCEGMAAKPCGAMGESCGPSDCCGPGMSCSPTDGGAHCAPMTNE